MHSIYEQHILIDIRGLEDVEKVEEINKKYWYACQRHVELRSLEQNGTRNSAGNGSSRFRDLMLCLPEIRHVVGKLLNCDFSKLPLLFKVSERKINLQLYYYKINRKRHRLKSESMSK